MGKSRPGSSFQVPNAKCLKGLEPNPKSELQTPSSGQWGDCRRKDQMRKETPEKAVLCLEPGKKEGGASPLPSVPLHQLRTLIQ